MKPSQSSTQAALIPSDGCTRARGLRRARVRRLLTASAALSFALLSTTQAFAFCRQNACEDGIRQICENFEDPDDCIEMEYACARDENECINEGNTLHRLSNCMSFAVARGNTAQLGLTDEDLLEVVTEAFQRWAAVDCGSGATPGFKIPPLGLVTAEEAYYCSEPTLNVSTWFLSDTWHHDPKALGFTFSTSNVEDGIVLDADVELNLEKIKGDFVKEDWRAVLLSIATHEAGHFLGLAHSLDPDAVMFAAYNRTNLHERELQQDDFDGICAVFPPDPTLTCEPPVLADPGLSEMACLLAIEAAGGADDSALTDTSDDDVAVDPLGEAVTRRGCTVLAGSHKHENLTLLGVFVALVLLVRRK